MHAVIKGPSSAGKSEIRKQVLKFFPPEDIISFTAMSDKALIHHGADFQHAILSMAEADGSKERAFQDYLLRELMSEGKIRYDVVTRIKGFGTTTVTVEKEGPVCFLVTTTKNRLHQENETRMLTLEVSDSEQQSRRVIEKIAEVDGLNDESPIGGERYDTWHQYQRHLRRTAQQCGIIVPYAPILAKMMRVSSVRQRRDFRQLLTAIKSHALLHHELRYKDGRGRIDADILDYAIVRDLMADLLAESAGVKVSAAMRETVDAVKQLQPLGSNRGVTAQDVAGFLGLDKSSAHRRLQSAIHAGLVVNLETRPSYPGQYRASEITGGAMDVLPIAEQLDAAWRSARK
jgi:hypothetical protein